MARKKLNAKKIREKLIGLPGWALKNGKLYRQFKFQDFKLAFAFMTSVALIAESLDHHPDWSNVYNRVIVKLHTHDLGGISTLDFKFAEQVNQLLV